MNAESIMHIFNPESYMLFFVRRKVAEPFCSPMR